MGLYAFEGILLQMILGISNKDPRKLLKEERNSARPPKAQLQNLGKYYFHCNLMNEKCHKPSADLRDRDVYLTS